MAIIFISYGDERFKESLNRIVRQAKKVGIFDKIIKYTPNDLPTFITSSPLFAFGVGGGCWSWKPWIIYHTLQQCKEGDVVFYCDAGCTLVKDSPEWQQFQLAIQTHTAIFFQYREGTDYGWASKCSRPENNSVAIKHWMKPTVADYFSRYIDAGFLDFAKIWAGFMIFKKTNPLSFILDQWMKITLFHPELVADPFGAELKHLPETYNAHRFDQGILTPLIYRYSQKDNALVLLETSESHIGIPAVLASRWRQGKMSRWQRIKYCVWRLIHGDP